MTNPLQDKRIVSVLALAAVLTVGWRIYGLKNRLSTSVAAASAEASASNPLPVPTANPTSESSPNPTASSAAAPTAPGSSAGSDRQPRGVRHQLRDWETMLSMTPPARDPFGPLLALADTDAATPDAAELPEADAWALQAVSIEPGKVFAVVNRQVLTVGEVIGDFVVERIRSNEVWLKHPKGRRVLRMEFTGVSRTEPTAGEPTASPPSTRSMP